MIRRLIGGKSHILCFPPGMLYLLMFFGSSALAIRFILNNQFVTLPFIFAEALFWESVYRRYWADIGSEYRTTLQMFMFRNKTPTL